MKRKLLTLALLTTLFISCSTDDEALVAEPIIENPSQPTVPIITTNCSCKLRLVRISPLRNQDTISDVTVVYANKNLVPNIIDAGGGEYFVGVQETATCGVMKRMEKPYSIKHLYIDCR